MTARIAPVIVLACIAGCTNHVRPALFSEDFESLCDGAPCGWVQVAGAAGAASVVETLPSEHGIELSGDGVAIARVLPMIAASPSGSAVPIDSDLRAHVVARCDPGSTVTVIVTLAGTGHAVDVSGGAIYPPTWDGTRNVVMLTPSDAMIDTAFTALLRVVLHKGGAGVCEVDFLSLADRDVPFPE